MAIFIKLEARLLQKARFDFYEQQAKVICSDLISKLALEPPHPVFIAIDFEGDVAYSKGVTELGLARLDPCHLELGIKGTNIATAGRKRRNFLFHDYMRIDIAQLPATIVKMLGEKQVVLVGDRIASVTN